MGKSPERIQDSDLWKQPWWSWRGTAKPPEREEFVRYLLRAYESRNVTYMEQDGSWPIIWRRAKGVYVWDESGKKYLDLTAAFGVAALGHANPNVVRAATDQMKVLLHAMGDVHPHALKGLLAKELSQLTFERSWYNYKKCTGEKFDSTWFETGKTIFCNSGFEAVEAALKTAYLSTRKRGVIAFEGAYHGLGYGALTATHREYFQSPFREQLADFCHFVNFPVTQDEVKQCLKRIGTLLQRHKIGAIVVEPIQVRAGVKISADGFLWGLRNIANQMKVILIYDEIYTGFGRTGSWFAFDYQAAPPDVICLGKALTGGFPLSACVGRATVMDAAWPPSSGEAIHTSTYLGHPVGCAMALAQIEELRGCSGPRRPHDWIDEACQRGHFLLRRLKTIKPPSGFEISVRGRGLLAAVELNFKNGKPATDLTLKIIKVMLHRGYILLPEGEHSNVISFSPPLTITRRQLGNTVAALKRTIAGCAKATT
jgi:4-aminobutyrate aminotransferase-like enzyme